MEGKKREVGIERSQKQNLSQPGRSPGDFVKGCFLINISSLNPALSWAWLKLPIKKNTRVIINRQIDMQVGGGNIVK